MSDLWTGVLLGAAGLMVLRFVARLAMGRGACGAYACRSDKGGAAAQAQQGPASPSGA